MLILLQIQGDIDVHSPITTKSSKPNMCISSEESVGFTARADSPISLPLLSGTGPHSIMVVRILTRMKADVTL